MYKMEKKHNIQIQTIMCEVWHVQKKNMHVLWINNCLIVLRIPRIMSSIHEMDCFGRKTIPVAVRFGARSSVASTRW